MCVMQQALNSVCHMGVGTGGATGTRAPYLTEVDGLILPEIDIL